MTTRIQYGGTGTGQQVSAVVNEAEIFVANFRRLMTKLNSASSNADWAAVAAEVGGEITNNQAQDLWTILATYLAIVDCPAFVEISRLDKS